MRVLRVLGSLDPTTGGPPSVFSAAVLASAGAGATIECLTFQPLRGEQLQDFPDYQRLVARGIKVHAVRGTLSACLLIYRQSRYFDIIHVDGCWVPISILALLIAKLTGRRSAVTPHETLTYEERRRTRSRSRALAKRLLSYYHLRLAGCIIHASALEERELSSPSQFRRYPARCARRYDVGCADHNPERLRRTASDFSSGYLGRFHPKKNLEHIVAASLQTANVRLLLAGGGPEGYERTLRALDLGNSNLSWLGFVKNEQREKFFREIDFLVLASEYECFGMAAAEAMVRGIPVIVTEKVGVADDVKRTGGGLVVAIGVEPLVDAFKRCADLSLDQYAELQENALKAATQYSYSAHGHSQVLAYRRTLEAR